MTLAERYRRGALAERLREQFNVRRRPSLEERYEWPPRVLPIDVIARMVEGAKPDGVRWARGVLSEASFSPIPSTTVTDELGRDAARGREARHRWSELVAKLSPDRLQRVLDDAASFGDYVRLHRLRPGLLAEALDRLPAELVARRIADGAQALYHFAPPLASAPETMATWRALWRHASGPIDYSALPGLPARIDPSLWDELFSTGFANRDAESALGCRLAQMPAAEMAALWPRMLRLFPNLPEVAPRMLLSQFRLVDSRRCTTTHELAEKLSYLASHGMARLVVGLDLTDGSYTYAPDDLKHAIVPFLPAPDRTAPSSPRISDAKVSCRFELTGPWFEALKDDSPAMNAPPPDDEDPVRFTRVQLIALPGREDCALLVIGHRTWVDEYQSELFDGFEGVDTNPRPSCPDPWDHNEIWLKVDGRIVRHRAEVAKDYSEAWLAAVRDAVSGRTYFMQIGERLGMCGGWPRIPPLYAWSASGDEWALRRVIDPELEETLHTQCTTGKFGVECRGISLLSPEAVDRRFEDVTVGSDPRLAPVPIDDFITAFRRHQHSAYLDAAMALDDAALARFEAMGVPARWTADAFSKLRESSLPDAQKRQRIARLIWDDTRFLRMSMQTPFDQLLDWLTLADWARLLGALGRPPWPLEFTVLSLDREQAAERGRHELACMIDNAAGLICGETIEWEPPPDRE